MITFSLRPSNGSFFPRIEASVRTRVVSWNEAADKKLLVSRAALVIPRITLCAVAGIPPEIITSRFLALNSPISINSPGKISVSPGSRIRTF